MAFCDGSFWVWEETPSGQGGIVPGKSVYMKIGTQYAPSTDWAIGGPIIEREAIGLFMGMEPERGDSERWGAFSYRTGGSSSAQYGPTYLVASMRCFVALRLGAEVEVPTELLEQS